jgi:hypothetical protein
VETTKRRNVSAFDASSLGLSITGADSRPTPSLFFNLSRSIVAPSHYTIIGDSQLQERNRPSAPATTRLSDAKDHK